MPPTSPETLSSDLAIPFLPAPPRTPLEALELVRAAELRTLREDYADIAGAVPVST